VSAPSSPDSSATFPKWPSTSCANVFLAPSPNVVAHSYVTSKGAEGLGALFAWVGIGIASFLILREILWSSRELKKAFASEHTDLDIREADERDKARFLTPTMTPASTHRLDPSSNV